MKNIQGKKEDLKLYNDKGVLVYKYYTHSNGFWFERTYDDNGNELTCKYSNGDWFESTYDDKGNQLTYKKSTGYWWERTYDGMGNELTYKNSDGYWAEKTYDDRGNELTYKDSKGVSRGFDIPEYTIEELTKIVGNEFKIKK